MADLRPDYLYSTSTLQGGNFRFNQGRYDQHDDQPSLVVLVGWDEDQGVFIWTVAGDEIPARADTQARGYSRVVPGVDPDAPPDWLGEHLFVPEGEMEDAGAWCIRDGLAPHPKRRAILSPVEKVQPQLFGERCGEGTRHAEATCSICQALSCLTAAGGQLDRFDDWRAERREVEVGHRAIASVGSRTAALPRVGYPFESGCRTARAAKSCSGGAKGWAPSDSRRGRDASPPARVQNAHVVWS